jgi:L-threonylcarbamoyladenylate synthase
MPLVNVDPRHPEAEIIARAALVLRQGGLVAFPTETVYGLGANALDAAAVAKIFDAKGRPAWNPVIAHVANAADARALTTHWPDVATLLADAFWPGPLTMVLPKREIVPDIVSAGRPAVALRVPAHPVALALIKAAGVPIAAPSANRFTELSPTTALHVATSLGSRVELILDGGASNVGIESTVVDLSNGALVVLRPGVIGRDAIARVAGVPVTATTREEADNTPRPSPGMMQRHYAPKADVWLFDSETVNEVRQSAERRAVRHVTERHATERHATERHSALPQTQDKIAALVLDWSLALPENVRAIPMPNNPLAYARALYATLHELDAEGYAVVAVERPPATDAWAGVHDRLKRAAH